MLRDADARQATRRDAHEPSEVVGRTQVDQATLDRRLAEEHRARGLLPGHRADARRDEAVVLREAVDRTAPRDLHDAVRRRELCGRLRERAVLHHEAAGKHCGEHGGAGDDADRNEERTLAARTEPRRDEAEREREPAQRRHVTAVSRGAVVSPAHTACAASTNARAAAE